jgi:hypothetical protein
VKKVNIESVLALILVARSGTEPYYDDSFVEACVQLLAKKPAEVFETKEFTRLDAQTIIFILKNDFLEIDELELFLHICRWGRAQANQGEELKEILTEEIMQHIRYPLIPSEELYNQVKITGLIPPKQWVEALEFIVTGDELPPKYAVRGGVSGSSGRKGFKSGNVISLMGSSCGKYLSALSPNGDLPSFTSQSISGNNEHFTVVEGNSGKFGLKTFENFYLSASDDKVTVSQYDQLLEWEIFDIIASENGKVVLQTPHATYLSMSENGEIKQTSSITKNEQFSVKVVKKH